MKPTMLCGVLWALSAASCVAMGGDGFRRMPQHRVEEPVPRDPRPGAPTTPAAISLVEDTSAVSPWAARARPEDVGLDRSALERLVAACEKTDSHALLVLARGRVVVERRFGHRPGPIEAMSVTKGIVGLAIGKLVSEKKIPSLDEPLSTYFPEWKKDKSDKKARVTVRHVLTHTSGLSHKPAAGELTKQKDRLKYVRGLPVIDEPGEKFSYNNEAIQLLAGVVEKASGVPLDVYVEREILKPLGIEHFAWAKDETGTPAAAWGLSIDAGDLAKIGQMLLEKGRFDGKVVVPETWVEAMVQPAKPNVSWHGLLAWLVYDGPYRAQTAARRQVFADLGVSGMDRLAPLDGKQFSTNAGYWMEAGALLDPSSRERLASLVRDDRLPFEVTPARYVGFNFNGWLGQYLVVVPEASLVAVRMRPEPPGGGDDADNERNGMREFVSLVQAAIPSSR